MFSFRPERINNELEANYVDFHRLGNIPKDRLTKGGKGSVSSSKGEWLVARERTPENYHILAMCVYQLMEVGRGRGCWGGSDTV